MKNINELIFKVNNDLRNNLNVEKDDIKELLAIAMKMEKQLFLSDVSKRYLVKFVDRFWFEHETEVNAIDEDEAIEKMQKKFKNASHFQVSEL